MRKPNWLKNTTATPRGFVDMRGRLIQPKRMTEAEIAEWNGTEQIVEPTQPDTSKDMIVETDSSEVNQEDVITEEETPAPKRTRRKKS